MGMPNNLILVRHGESEGNVATALSKKGDNSLFTAEFLNRHNSTWRLTKRGRNQATRAGIWIRKNIGLEFDRYYVSEFDRAKETAAFLDLPKAEWFVSFYLRERDWGEMDVITEEERRKRYPENLRRRLMSPLYWAPTNGESLANVCLRVERVINTLYRECDGKNVIVVCHGDIMWAFRVVLERMSYNAFIKLEKSKKPQDRILNCQVLQYTRLNPKTQRVEPYLNWMRSICPTDVSLSSNVWKKIIRKRYSNEELLKEVEKRRRV